MKKTFKGFTLVEVLIAMGVLGIMTLMLSVCYTAVCTTNLRSSQMNDRVDLMMPYAEGRADLDLDDSVASDEQRYTTGTYSLEIKNITNDNVYNDCHQKKLIGFNADGSPKYSIIDVSNNDGTGATHPEYEAELTPPPSGSGTGGGLTVDTYQVFSAQYVGGTPAYYEAGSGQDEEDYADGNFNFFEPQDILIDYTEPVT